MSKKAVRFEKVIYVDASTDGEAIRLAWEQLTAECENKEGLTLMPVILNPPAVYVR